MIPLDSPNLLGNEKKYLNECIDTNWISWQGPFVSKLENSVSRYCKTEHGIAVVNGTSALVMALKSLGIKEGDEVIVPSLTMSASVFSITSVGATPIWVDSYNDLFLMDPADVQRKITEKTKAVLAVHLYGRSVDMIRLVEICSERNIPIIEDAAESFGAEYLGNRVGSLGTIACHSFHNKIIGSGEGGAITVNDEFLKEKLLDLRVPSPNNIESTVMSLNYRMSNLAAAVALAQLERVEEIIDLRRNVANLYDYYLEGVSGIRIFKERKNERAVYWRYQVYFETHDTDLIVNELKIRGIESRKIFSPMNLHPYYNEKTFLPNTYDLSNKTIDIPSGPSLSKHDVEFVAKTLVSII